MALANGPADYWEFQLEDGVSALCIRKQDPAWMSVQVSSFLFLCWRMKPRPWRLASVQSQICFV